MGLQQILGAISGGGLASWDYVGAFLRNNYVDNQAEKDRRAAAEKRDAIYANKGDKYLEELVNKCFTDTKTRELRDVLRPWAKWNNLTRRIVREQATVYKSPARRSVTKRDEQYQAFLKVVKKDLVMRELDRKLALHEDAWVQYRVKKTAAGPAPTIDVISPASFWAIAHPRDATTLIGIILDQRPTYQNARDTDPYYRVWTDDETFLMDAQCRVFPSSVEPWALGRMPGVLATLVPPSTKGRLLAECPMADLIAGHEACMLQNLLLLKESKSASKQTVHTGDTSASAPGQSTDTEADLVMPEGVSTQVIDRGMDLAQFRDNSTFIGDDVGSNYGVPPSVRHQRDAASGAEIMMRRIPIMELREERIPVFRDVEREMAVVESGVNRGENLVQWVFDVEGWRVDFGEVKQPMTTLERNQNFEIERRLLMKDTLEEARDRNPDIETDEDAKILIKSRAENETWRVGEMKDLMALNGSVETAPGEPTPAQNGARGAGNVSTSGPPKGD